MANTVTELLRRRFFGGSGSNIIYQVSDLTFDGTNNLDTGITLMDGRDFEMHIVFTPSQLSTSVRYFACRTTVAPFVGIDWRYALSKWDMVGNNSDNHFNSPLPEVGTSVDITITRINGSLVCVCDGTSKTIMSDDCSQHLFIGSDANGNRKAKMYLSELTIKEL